MHMKCIWNAYAWHQKIYAIWYQALINDQALINESDADANGWCQWGLLYDAIWYQGSDVWGHLMEEWHHLLPTGIIWCQQVVTPVGMWWRIDWCIWRKHLMSSGLWWWGHLVTSWFKSDTNLPYREIPFPSDANRSLGSAATKVSLMMAGSGINIVWVATKMPLRFIILRRCPIWILLTSDVPGNQECWNWFPGV